MLLSAGQPQGAGPRSASRRTEIKMKMDRAPVLFALWIALVINLGGASPTRGAGIKPSKEWTGQLEDGTLKKKKKPVDRLFAADDFITNKEDFAKLWKEWMGNE